jgi:elongation factor G
MKSYKPSDVRVVGIFGHRAAGKTSAAEALLYTAGATSRLGQVEAGNLALELDQEALERQMTVQANAGFLEHDGCRICLLDTPGDSNFWGATSRALRVVDAGVLVLSAADGVEPLALRTSQELAQLGVPQAVLVTKLDKDNTSFADTLEEIRSELAKESVAISLPIKSGAQLAGVVSLLTRKAYVVDGDRVKEVDVPAEMAEEVLEARELLFDAVAAHDDELAETYLEEGELSDDEVARGLRAAFAHAALTPVFAAASTREIGIRVLLDALARVFPSPLERPARKGYRDARMEEPVERTPDPTGGLVAQVFRTFHDPFAGTLSYARIWSGTLKAGEDVYNARRESSDRPSHIYFPMGGIKGGAEVKEASVGDVVVITKLKTTHTGDTLTTKDDPTFLPPFEEPEALLAFGIKGAEKKDEDKISTTIAKIVEEDPSLRFERDPDTKEMLLSGLGQAHIDYVVERLKRANINVELREPKVPYRETIRAPIKGVEGKHKKQTGGSGQFGVCFINVEPLPRGAGFEFENQIVGGAIPRQYIPSVEKGIRDTLRQGPLSGNEVVDLRVTLYDGKYHSVDSNDMAFQAAGRKAIREVFSNAKAKPVLLEPYMHVDISCPADSVGDVMGDLNSRRARVNDMTTEGKRGRISASVPMNEILRYTNVLKSLTSGRGSFTMRFERYEEAPANVQQQVVEAYQKHARDDS